MNPRAIIAGAFDAIDRYPGVLNITEEDSYLPHADVVLAWQPKVCATCDGKQIVFEEDDDFVGNGCRACSGSGVDGYTVTLRTLAKACWHDGVNTYRLVAVSPEPPKEPKL